MPHGVDIKRFPPPPTNLLLISVKLVLRRLPRHHRERKRKGVVVPRTSSRSGMRIRAFLKDRLEHKMDANAYQVTPLMPLATDAFRYAAAAIKRSSLS
jgi:hypothetical protein